MPVHMWHFFYFDTVKRHTSDTTEATDQLRGTVFQPNSVCWTFHCQCSGNDWKCSCSDLGRCVFYMDPNGIPLPASSHASTITYLVFFMITYLTPETETAIFWMLAISDRCYYRTTGCCNLPANRRHVQYLTPADDIGTLTQQVDDLAFAFIAPLCS